MLMSDEVCEMEITDLCCPIAKNMLNSALEPKVVISRISAEVLKSLCNHDFQEVNKHLRSCTKSPLVKEQQAFESVAQKKMKDCALSMGAKNNESVKNKKRVSWSDLPKKDTSYLEEESLLIKYQGRDKLLLEPSGLLQFHSGSDDHVTNLSDSAGSQNSSFPSEDPLLSRCDMRIELINKCKTANEKNVCETANENASDCNTTRESINTSETTQNSVRTSQTNQETKNNCATSLMNVHKSELPSNVQCNESNRTAPKNNSLKPWVILEKLTGLLQFQNSSHHSNHLNDSDSQISSPFNIEESLLSRCKTSTENIETTNNKNMCETAKENTSCSNSMQENINTFEATQDSVSTSAKTQNSVSTSETTQNSASTSGATQNSASTSEETQDCASTSETTQDCASTSETTQDCVSASETTQDCASASETNLESHKSCPKNLLNEDESALPSDAQYNDKKKTALKNCMLEPKIVISRIKTADLESVPDHSSAKWGGRLRVRRPPPPPLYRPVWNNGVEPPPPKREKLATRLVAQKKINYCDPSSSEDDEPIQKRRTVKKKYSGSDDYRSSSDESNSSSEYWGKKSTKGKNPRKAAAKELAETRLKQAAQRPAALSEYEKNRKENIEKKLAFLKFLNQNF